MTDSSSILVSGLAGSGGGVSDGDKGDLTVAGGVYTIDNDSITYAKIQNVSATDKVLGRSSSGAGDIEEIACTAAGRALIDDADASAQRTTLGLVIGTNVQAFDADLTTLASKFTTATATVGASLDFNEGTNNGVNTASITAPASLGANRVLTLPDASGTIARTADITGTNSGTNTGDQNIFSTIAVSGQSDVVADTTGDTLTLAAGTGITITTNAGTDTVTITNSASSALTLLATTSASTSSTVDFNSTYITSTYKEYLVEFINLVPTAASDRLMMRFSQSGTFNTGGSSYTYLHTKNDGSTVTSAVSSANSSIILEANGSVTTANKSTCGYIRVFDPTKETLHKSVQYYVDIGAASNKSTQGSGAFIGATTACDGIRFYFETDTIASGTFKLYGVS